MTMTEKNDKVTETKENEEELYQVTPRYGIWTEDDKVTLQIAIPGVKKENISMKALADYFTLRARRNNVEYSLDLDFGIEIEPTSTNANYEEGLLRIEFKRFKPLEHAFEVKIE